VGIYYATVTLTYGVTVDNSSQNTFLVNLYVTSGGSGGGPSPGETLTSSPTSLSFSYTSGASVPAAQSLSIASNDATGFTATAQTNDGNQWLSVTPASVTSTPTTLTVSVNPAILAAGSYTGTVTLVAPSSNLQIPVSLSVGGGGISVTPTSLTFNVPQGYGLSAPQFLQVSSPNPSPFQTLASSDFNWLIVDTPSGTTPASVSVRANASSSLAQGAYSGTATVQLSPSVSMQVPVALNVGPPATLSLAPTLVTFTYTIGNAAPGTQAINVKSLTGAVQTFTASATTTDGAAWLTAMPTGPTPAQVTVGVNPGTLVPGSYTGVVSVTPSAMGSSSQPVQVSLTVLPAPTPTILSVASSASYVTGTVAPGEFVTLFGSAVGPANPATPTPGTAPKILGGTTVTFDGIPAPILYTSATQTSVQVPYGIALPQTVLQVTRNNVSSAATSVSSVPAFPGLFTANSSGKGQVAALNADGSLNGPSNPALRGSFIVLYGTGEGRTSPISVEGTITPSVQPLPQPLFPVSVSFSGVAGTVLYAGETPTALAGLMQINAGIPLNAPTGPAVSVLVSINGQTSPGAVTVAIQ
jgi:uncharacterized protein (TIGR03437 family)